MNADDADALLRLAGRAAIWLCAAAALAVLISSVLPPPACRLCGF